MPARKLLLPVVLLGLIAPLALATEPDLHNPSLTDAELIEGIRWHWAQRTAGVTSWEFDVETEHTAWIDLRDVEALDAQEPNHPNDPFAEPKPNRKPVRWQLRYYVEQDKAAFHEMLLNADQVNPEVVSTTAMSMAFDGERTVQFVASRNVQHPMAFIDVGNKAARDMSNYSSILPIVLWRDPGEMFRIGRWNSKQMEVVDRGLDVEGRACIRLALKRRGGGAIPQIAWLDIDPARGAAPVRWEFRQGDRLLSSIEIEYDDESGPAPSGWTYNMHPPKRGETGSTYYARVTTAKLNEDVADENFGVALPAGTLVREKEGDNEREYYTNRIGDAQ